LRDADGRDCNLGRDPACERFSNRLQHDGKCARVGDGARVRFDRRPIVFVATLRAERAERVDRLRGQPDMAHDGRAALDQERNRLRHAAPAFELDGAAAGFL
jgi:hypothetical protein